MESKRPCYPNSSVVRPALFVTKRDKRRLAGRTLEHAMRTYMDAAGLEKATVHDLRHSFAKNLIDRGTLLQVMAQLAGHESLQVTRRYVTPSEADLRKAVEGIVRAVPVQR
ncbi:MAG: site-specific integrase [Firmicutes bacterium]|nr:site-specific integrase [Bacillota bacterium]